MADGTSDPLEGQGGQSGGNGGASQVVLDGSNWGNFIPEDLKEDQNFKPFEGKEIGDVLRSFVNAQRMIGADKVIVPAGKFDTPEVWSGVYDRLGRPKEPDGYKFETPQLPQGMALDPELEGSFKKFAHESGLSQKQAAGLYQFYNTWVTDRYTKFSQAQAQAQTQALEKAEKTLKDEFGAKYDDKVLLAKKVIRTYGGTPEEVEAFIGQQGNNPLVIRTLVKLGELISEDKLISGDKPEWDLGSEGSRKKAIDIMSNETNPLHKAYLDKSHIQHTEAVNEVERLFQMAAGGNK